MSLHDDKECMSNFRKATMEVAGDSFMQQIRVLSDHWEKVHGRDRETAITQAWTLMMQCLAGHVKEMTYNMMLSEHMADPNLQTFLCKQIIDGVTDGVNQATSEIIAARTEADRALNKIVSTQKSTKH